MLAAIADGQKQQSSRHPLAWACTQFREHLVAAGSSSGILLIPQPEARQLQPGALHTPGLLRDVHLPIDTAILLVTAAAVIQAEVAAQAV